MAVKFFKKFEPNLGVSIGEGRVVKFQSLNGIIGYFATDDGGIQSAFKTHIENARFGMSEIAFDEFNSDFLKKKKIAPQLRKPWREELSSQGTRLAKQLSPDVKKAVAVAGNRNGSSVCARVAMDDSSPEYGLNVSPAPSVDPAPEPAKFNPPVGKREPRA